ncbi:MAG: UDP-3-O-(3-hydroxymyristoyl)glucosamine N-acyltransferase [Bacteroidia bacterium]|nr:UDP-3-O-(3-hydroxymyristoyl)glucosamine N-acyltransferase [Bacteroidia bacterium]
MSLREVAQLIGAVLEGDPGVPVRGASRIEDAAPGTVTFLGNPRYEPYLAQCQASAVIVPLDYQAAAPLHAALLRVQDPYQAFARLLEHISEAKAQHPAGMEAPVHLGADVQLGQDLYIGAFSYIGDGAVIGDRVRIYPQSYIGAGAVIGDDTVLYPQTTVYAGSRIGKRCMIHSGARIGSDGFGFLPQADGSYRKVPQTGIAVLEDDVEIGANTCIDRAVAGETRIGAGVKLDNLVQIAHNVGIGAHTVIAAQTGIAGSTRLGRNCRIGGQAGIVGHLEIADQTQIDAQSGVNASIRTPGLAFRGSPAQPFRKQLRSEVLFRKLEEMQQRLHQLEQAIKQGE